MSPHCDQRERVIDLPKITLREFRPDCAEILVRRCSFIVPGGHAPRFLSKHPGQSDLRGSPASSSPNKEEPGHAKQECRQADNGVKGSFGIGNDLLRAQRNDRQNEDSNYC